MIWIWTNLYAGLCKRENPKINFVVMDQFDSRYGQVWDLICNDVNNAVQRYQC